MKKCFIEKPSVGFKMIVCFFRSVRVQLIARATFMKDPDVVADDGTTLVSRINAYFHSRSTIVAKASLWTLMR